MRTLAALCLLPVVADTAPAGDTPLAAELRFVEQTLAAGPFKPEWESLKAHSDPEWFRDAKFGIYTHWGPVTVGAEDAPSGGWQTGAVGAQWYGMAMYQPASKVFSYHQAKFGDPGRVGYKDLVGRFTAEQFDPEAWAELFAQAGAKFAGPVAIHHDNFALWDSRLTRWNSVGMGPRRDVTGELGNAIRARGLKLLTTFHHGFAWRYFEPSFHYDGADPRNADLYTEVHGADAPPSTLFQDTWLALVSEVLRRYQPDLIWFDFEFYKVIQPGYQQKLFATAYDWAAQNHRTIGVCHKSRDIHRTTGILDFERGREDQLVPYPWLTDTSVGPWFNQKVERFKATDTLVDVLVDIVSKNGCLLLNVGPAADGTIPQEARRRLLELGGWLKVNGEAIYGTRPWKTYGEGPTRQAKAGGFSENADQPFTAQDIRFTTKDGALYAIALAPPLAELKISSLHTGAGKVAAVSLLGSDAKLQWQQDTAALTIQPVAAWPSPHAVAFKIDWQSP